MKKLTAVGLQSADQGYVLSYCTLELKGKEVKLSDSADELSLETFVQKTDAAIPLVLVIDGKGVIHRRISMNETDDLGSILHKTLPNISADDFYVSHTEPFNGHAIASVCRRQLLNEAVQFLTEKKRDVIGATLGPFCIQAVLSLINNGYNADVNIPGAQIRFTDGFVSEYVPGNQDVKSFSVSGETIAPSRIVAFAAAFASLLGIMYVPLSNLPLAAWRDQYAQKKLYKTGLVSAACFLFVVLLINFFLLTHFNEKKSDLEARINVNQSSISQIDTLKKELAEKEAIVSKTRLLQTSRTSFYADRIASMVPFNVKLTCINVYPRETNGAEESESSYRFKPGEIEIQGKCKYSIDVNDWINNMRSFSWIKEIKLEHYNPSNTDKGSDFVIRVML
ncbi:MAG: hypothetical protein JST26_08010 [Bacteroidetes bacterium]|nr:hypothetical protein [Bacteroidota bacterium]